jgi:hypothetical protein
MPISHALPRLPANYGRLAYFAIEPPRLLIMETETNATTDTAS